MKVGEHREALVERVRLLSQLFVALLATIAACFWFVQVVQGSHYRGLAENNRLRKVPIRAPRGIIYDRAGRALLENVPSYDLLLDPTRIRDLEASLGFAGELLGRPAEELRALLAREQAAGAGLGPVLLAENLRLSEVARFGVHSLEHPEFEVEVGHLRLYRHGEQTAHVLGYLGEVTATELEDADGARDSGELVGRKGIEQRYDAELRGAAGQRVVVVDSRGRLLEEHLRQAARPGRDLRLTLDLELQQQTERAFAADGKVGAVVALDPRSGAVRALVSSPAYNPNLFARRLAPEEWQALITSPHHPLQNRALQNTYAPGSVFKIVMAVAGLSEGVVAPGDGVYCSGAASFYGHRFRCWKRGGHGRVDLHAALRGSCDVYFYTLGQKLGIERIARYARLFGLGEPTGIDLEGEKSGLVPSPGWSLAVRKHPWYPGETISVAIGQGPVLVTPLQIATLFAAVANGGHRITPHLVPEAARPPAKLPLNAEALARVRHGLWAVVNDRGTAAQARVEGLDVAGKTGTVQVVQQKTWTESRDLPYERRDHAWFASFAPVHDPGLVVVVFVEHGGKGSAAAAPIAKVVHETYFRDDLSAHRQPAAR
jgi:penicillin-binding protein 2